MNFFEQQDKTKRNTRYLVFLFVMAVILIIAACNAVIYGGLYYASLQQPHLQSLMREPLWLPITGGVLVVVGLGTLIKMFRLRAGGVSVANMVGARPIAPEPPFLEQRFVHIVEEMSIASGVSVPKLYVLEENSINAFVAGLKPEDTVMVVTQGALDTLNRDELQAVVGHEFSHIFNQDMSLNIKMMGVLAGILVIGQLGRGFFRTNTRTRFRASARSGRRSGNGGLVIVMIAVGLMMVGYIGVFFGRLIKAAVSRQRELLADASAIQYTRNPQGLVSAFKTMMVHESGTTLETNHTEDISHFCFAPALNMWFSGLLATHPPLDARIKNIDPKGQYPRLQRETFTQESEESKPSEKEKPFEQLFPAMLGAVIYTTAQTVKDSIGTCQQGHIEYAQALSLRIPDMLKQATKNPIMLEPLLAAMVLPTDLPEYTPLLKPWGHHQKHIHTFKTLLDETPMGSYLPILEWALPTFSALKLDKRQALYEKLVKMVTASQSQPFDFSLLVLLKKRLPKDKATQRSVGLEAVQSEFALLLAVLLQESGQSETEQKKCFEAAFKRLNLKPMSFEPVEKLTFDRFSKALEKCNALKPRAKEQCVGVWIDCVMQDDKVLVKEAELLRAMLEALECPIPPILS